MPNKWRTTINSYLGSNANIMIGGPFSVFVGQNILRFLGPIVPGLVLQAHAEHDLRISVAKSAPVNEKVE